MQTKGFIKIIENEIKSIYELIKRAENLREEKLGEDITFKIIQISGYFKLIIKKIKLDIELSGEELDKIRQLQAEIKTIKELNKPRTKQKQNLFK